MWQISLSNSLPLVRLGTAVDFKVECMHKDPQLHQMQMKTGVTSTLEHFAALGVYNYNSYAPQWLLLLLRNELSLSGLCTPSVLAFSKEGGRCLP